MRHRVRNWKTLPAEHKDYVFIYAWGTLWALAYLVFPPTSASSVIAQLTIILWTIVTAGGGITALIGLITRDNLIIERLGVTLLMIGPVVYTVIQAAVFITMLIEPSIFPATSVATDRIALMFLGLWPFLFLNKRRRQLKLRVDIAKKTPLESEGKSIEQ